MPHRFALILVGVVFSACTATTTETTVISPTTTPVTATTGATTTQPPVLAPEVGFVRIDDPSFDGGFLNAVAEGGPGLVAVGTAQERDDAAVWVSADAATWERIESDTFDGVPNANGVDGEQAMYDLTSLAGLLVAVGSDELQETHDVDAAVWLSADGRDWERITDDDLGGGGYQAMTTVTVWNGDLYAGGEYQIGATGVFRPGMWRSADGRDWERIEHPLFLSFGATVTDVTARGSTLVVGGFDDLHENRPVIWITTDGDTWDAVRPGEEGDAVVGEITEPEWDTAYSLFLREIVATPDGWLAIGTIGDPSSGVTWTSQDAYHWELTAVLADYERPRADILPRSAIATSSGMVLVGALPLDSSGYPPVVLAVAWVSEDSGASWAQVPRTSSSMAVEGPAAPWHVGTMQDVIVFGDRLVAVGYISVTEVTEPGDFYDQAVWIGTWG
jgi:hypothetical protein